MARVTSGGDLIETELTNGVATLWLNRPESLNALTVQLIDQACKQLIAWGEDPAVRCIVLRGRGRAFCAGDDLKGMGRSEEDLERMDFVQRRESGFERLFHTIYESHTPVIAAVHGHTVGAGALIALAADIRLAREDTKMGFVFVRRGITGGTTIPARYIGLGKAHELLLTGDMVEAEEAARIGLVNYAVEADKFESTVEHWAQKLANGPTRVLGYAKYALHHGLYQDVRTAFAINSAVARYSQDTKDSAEGRAAFREKRAPQFQGL